jgi:hypothetical protein
VASVKANAAHWLLRTAARLFQEYVAFLEKLGRALPFLDYPESQFCEIKRAVFIEIG